MSLHDPIEDFKADLRRVGEDRLRQAFESGEILQPSLPNSERPTSDQIVHWCEVELGLKLKSVPRVLSIFLVALRSFEHKRMLRLAVLGPRGGGKTKLTAAIELVAYRWFGYSWQNIGGSLEQAARCYSYIAGAHVDSQHLASFTTQTHARETRSRNGGTIGVNAASQTSVRGPHPVGPSGGGGITLDEAALIPDDICDAAKGQLTTANPSALVQLSTMGEQQAGRFWELLQDPKKFGYRLERFDIFDVAARCSYDCATTCPVKEHFAQDYYEGPVDARQLVHKAYCGGRAHDVDGWVSVDEIAQQFREGDRASFERELMGKATSIVGHVYDPTLLHAAVLEPKWLSKDPASHRRRFLALDKVVGCDFGFSGQTALCYALRLGDAMVVYDWEFFTREHFQKIREHVLARMFEDRIETFLGDSASPNELEELAEMASLHATEKQLDWNPRVLPVVFSKWKMYLIGDVRRRLETGLLKFATEFGGTKVNAHDAALRYLLDYHTDQKGNIVKVMDHGPDSLICAVAGWTTSFRAATTFVGAK